MFCSWCEVLGHLLEWVEWGRKELHVSWRYQPRKKGEEIHQEKERHEREKGWRIERLREEDMRERNSSSPRIHSPNFTMRHC